MLICKHESKHCKLVYCYCSESQFYEFAPINQFVTANCKQPLVKRRGKYLLFSCDRGTIILHLGMSGSLRILTHPTPPQKHDHVDILFANNKILRFSDPRRFGALLWTSEDPAQHPLIQNLGVEPLDKAFSSDYLWTRAKKSKTPIKSFIMNNQIVVGVGNIYATEALFLAGIYPNTPAKNLSIKNFQKLTEVIKIVLKHAIERGGTTLRDFVKSDGKPGYFSTELKAYGRAGLPCLQCRTILKSMCIQQRSTVYCEQCQSQ